MITRDEKMTILEQRMREIDTQVQALADKRVELYMEWYALWSEKDREKMEAWK